MEVFLNASHHMARLGPEEILRRQMVQDEIEEQGRRAYERERRTKPRTPYQPVRWQPVTPKSRRLGFFEWNGFQWRPCARAAKADRVSVLPGKPILGQRVDLWA